MKKTFILSAMAAVCLLMVSCKKTDTPANTTTTTTTTTTITAKTCRVATMKIISDFNADTSLTSYEYNSAGKVSKQNIYFNGKLNNYTIYDYSTNGKVIEKTYYADDNTLLLHIIYILGSNGYVSSKIDLGFGISDTVLYEYNTNGYKIKSTDKRNGVINYTITNGNVSQEIAKDTSGNILYTTTYEYMNKVDKMGILLSFQGKGNVNILFQSHKKLSTGQVNLTYSYTMDSNGYPSEIVETYICGDIQKITKTTYTYTCQ